ncbi:MAG: conjugal transfer protein TraF, partial [Gammaproteobacteria bacterium]|nr:conjugal transfer protein TraF [Gammaproteobacteria bacterium]
VAKNLISETFAAGGTSMEFDTKMRVGAAYNTDWFTIAVDMDLDETDPILVEDPSKMLGVGIEVNAWDFMQLRAGYQTNMASGATADDLISAGIGLWLGFNLDIAAVVSEDSVGAFVQTGFRF